MKKLLGLVLLGTGILFANETKISGFPKDIQTHSLNHPNSLARGVTVFNVIGNSSATCQSFWIADSDKGILASILSAKTTSASIDVFAETTAGTPWGNPNICRVNSIVIP